MTKAVRTVPWAFLAVFAGVFGSHSAVADGTTEGHWLPLFVIERSNSKNRVHYDLAVDAQCRPLGEEPVKIYWRMLEKGPDEVEGLNFIERGRAYGLKFQQRVGDWVHFRFKAYPQRLARVHSYERNGRCHAEMWAEINGRPAIVDRVWVKVVREKWWKFPTVPFVDAFAHTPDGELVQERIVP